MTTTPSKAVSVKPIVLWLAGISLTVGIALMGINFIGTMIASNTPKTTPKKSDEKSSVSTGAAKAPEWVSERQVTKVAVPVEKVKPVIAKENNIAQAATETPPVATTGTAPTQTTPSEPNTSNEQMQKAMAVSLTHNQLLGDNKTVSDINRQDIQPPADDHSAQANKQPPVTQSTPEILLSSLKPPTPYEVKAGSIIPGVLITGINSDLPGQITAQVRAPVYDSTTGNHLLIPQGSKIVGRYESQVAFGQERVLIAWNRLLFPNGQSLNIQGMPGSDVSGYAGFKDQVNHHYGRIIGATLLMSAISAGAQLSQAQRYQQPNSAPTVGQTLAQSLGTGINQTSQSLLNKNLNIPPTITIRPGYLFNIQVTQDMVFPSPYADKREANT